MSVYFVLGRNLSGFEHECKFYGSRIAVLMQIHTTSIPAIMKFTKHGLVTGTFAPFVINFIITGVEVVSICIIS